jgi:pimeloyl-ACP methyl ester carboxylesterase
MTESAPRILACPDGSSIAYHKTEGASPTVVFLTGFMSDMTGGKAIALEEMCKARGQAFLRFDYTGHGASSGRFEEGTIGRWKNDALAAIDNLTQGPLILVGSSMGGWIMLLSALERRERVVGLVGVAPAPDFTEDLIARELTPEQRETVLKKGRVEIPSDYDPEPYIITRDLIEDGRNHLLLADHIALDCPIRLIHGMEDKDVPWKTSLRIAEQVGSTNVEVTFVKSGGHRLSEPEDLDRLCRTVEGLLQKPD